MKIILKLNRRKIKRQREGEKEVKKEEKATLSLRKKDC